MRSIFLPLIIILFATPLISKSQVTELHFFSQKEIKLFNTTQGTWYAERILQDTIMSVYKSDFSLYKEIPLSKNSFQNFYDIYYLSDKLFNSDSKIEFVMRYPSGSNSVQIGIYNEDGELIYDLGTYTTCYCVVYNRENLKPLLVIHYLNDNNDWGSRLFELPGDYLQVEEIGTTGAGVAYPNPTDGVIEIPLSVSNQNDLSFKIYNTSGTLVDQKILNPFDRTVRFEAGSLPSGVYLYSGGGVNGKFTVK